MLSPYSNQSRSHYESNLSQFNSKDQLLKIKSILSPKRTVKHVVSGETSPRYNDNSGFNNNNNSPSRVSRVRDSID